jgi:addiction module HigA family antidote
MRTPENAVHPGQFLKFYLGELEMTQTALAKKLGCKPAKINEICTGKRGISADLAVQLSRCLGTTPELWVNAQKSWELSEALKRVG